MKWCLVLLVTNSLKAGCTARLIRPRKAAVLNTVLHLATNHGLRVWIWKAQINHTLLGLAPMIIATMLQLTCGFKQSSPVVERTEVHKYGMGFPAQGGTFRWPALGEALRSLNCRDSCSQCPGSWVPGDTPPNGARGLHVNCTSPAKCRQDIVAPTNPFPLGFWDSSKCPQRRCPWRELA